MQSAECIAFRRATLESRSFCWNAGVFLASHVADVSRFTFQTSDSGRHNEVDAQHSSK